MNLDNLINYEQLSKQFSEQFGQEITVDMIRQAIMVYIVFAAIWFVAKVLYANAIRKSLLTIKPENRLMQPYQAWFVLIPLFNIYWNFQVNRNLSDSFNNEFFDRKIAVEENQLFKIGSLYAWTFLATNIPFPPAILMIAFLSNIGIFINYWLKINAHKNILVEHNRFRNEQEFDGEDEN